MHPNLTIDHRGATAVIRLSRPAKRNALSTSMLAALVDALSEAEQRNAAVVLTGADDVFSAGYDVSELGRGEDDLGADEAIAAASAAVSALSIPVLAAIEGACVGAAVELALACDVRIAGRGAFFSVPAARLGVLYRPDGIAGMVAAIGRETAMRLLVLGHRIGAEDAVGAGLVSRTVAAGRALEAALEATEPVAGSVRDAVAATKDAIVAASRLHADLTGFEERRRALLRSEERRQRVADLQGHRTAEPDGRGPETDSTTDHQRDSARGGDDERR